MRYILCTTLFLVLTTLIHAQIPGLTKLDLNPSGNSYPLYLTAFNAANGGKICFWANDGGTKGWELYTSDGINKPVLVYDVNAGSDNGIMTNSNHPAAVLNGNLYYTGDNGLSGPELYMFNGATMPVIKQDILTGTEGSNPDDYAVLSNTLYFRARTNSYGYELYSYDPATNFTNRLTDLNPGPDSSITGNIIAYNNRMFFTADSGQGGNELYYYEPLSSIATMLADIRPGNDGSFPQNLTVVNGKLYFTADNGTNGRELWMFDGTNPPSRITDMVSGFLSGLPSRDEPIIAEMGGSLYFNGKDTTSGKYLLFAYNPANNTINIAPKFSAAKCSDPIWLTPYGGKLYFAANNDVDTTGFELWSYDTTNGAKLVLELCPGPNGSNPEQLTVIGNDLFFKAEQCNGVGIEVFRFNYQEVGIKNAKFQGRILLYPNPAKNSITIDIIGGSTEKLNITFADITGKQMLRQAINSASVSISTADWTPGVYVYTLHNTEGSTYTTGKVVVQ